MPLDETRHIGGEENVKALILNIADLAAYTEYLEAVIKCYKVGIDGRTGSNTE